MPYDDTCSVAELGPSLRHCTSAKGDCYVFYPLGDTKLQSHIAHRDRKTMTSYHNAKPSFLVSQGVAFI